MNKNELSAIYHELNFWKSFVKTDRFLKGWVAPGKTPELHQETADFILSVPHETVLDVGSGVVSILNGLVPVKAVDPLGDLYSLIYDYKYPNQKPQAIPAEEIDFINEYDIVHISNALDHCQNPYLVYKNLLRAVKPEGYLIVQGFENEATFENWQGFHQWNLRIENNILVIDGKERTERITGCHKVFEKTLDNKKWFIWIAKKSY